MYHAFCTNSLQSLFTFIGYTGVSVGKEPAHIQKVKLEVEGEYTMVKWLKVVGSLVGAALLATLVAGAVFAQGPVGDGDGVRDLDGTGLGWGRGSSYGFVDEDGDGVNDRYGSDPEFVDEDGDGICDLCGGVPGEGDGRENGYGFVDEDGDGVNDRYGPNPEFVDEDGDGICDTHGVAPGEGAAQGYGRRFRAGEGA
jgi:hypothetical protein